MKNSRIVCTIILIAAMLVSCGKKEDKASSVTTFAGKAGNAGLTDGTGDAARFNNPAGITSDGTNLYVADTDNNIIRKIIIDTGEVTIFAGKANGDSGADDGIGTTASFNSPYGITTDGTNLYVTDYSNSTIRKIVIASKMVTTLAGTAGSHGSSDGSGTDARFYNPAGITTDGTNLYVTDYSNSTIRKIVIDSKMVTTLAGVAESYGSIDGSGTDARFNYPAGIISDDTNLYVSDSGNNTIRKIVTASGVVTTLAGRAGDSGSADGSGAGARFNYPAGIISDGGNLYVSDSANHTIRKIVIDSGAVTTWAGQAGDSGSADGSGTDARFNYPNGIAKEGNNLYVADSGNNTIRKLSLN